MHLKQAQVEETERTVLALNELKTNMETQRDKLNVAIDRMVEEVRQMETKVKKVQQQVSDRKDWLILYIIIITIAFIIFIILLP